MCAPSPSPGEETPLSRAKPPASLDHLRALLDAASARRALIAHDTPLHSAEERAAALELPLGGVCATVIAEADGDPLVAISSGAGRLDLHKLAAALGARRVQLVGPEYLRRRFGYEPGAVPLLTALPTVLDRALLAREHLFGPTGDALWTLRVAPADLRKITGALVADIVHGPQVRTDRAEQ